MLQGGTRRPVNWCTPNRRTGQCCHRLRCMMWHAPRASPEPFKVTVRSITGRVRAAIGAGLLLVAVGTSACSLNSSSPGRSLPISLTPSIPIVHPSNCTLNSSGTQAVATGTFSPPASLPVVDGQQVGALQLQLRVVTSQSFLGHRNVGVGESSEGVSVGQTSWHLVTPVERAHGLRATRCEVTFGDFGI